MAALRDVTLWAGRGGRALGGERAGDRAGDVSGAGAAGVAGVRWGEARAAWWPALVKGWFLVPGAVLALGSVLLFLGRPRASLGAAHALRAKPRRPRNCHCKEELNSEDGACGSLGAGSPPCAARRPAPHSVELPVRRD